MGDHEIQKLRAALARRERGRGKRYTSSLKERVAAAATALRRQGQGWQAIGKFFGIPHETIRRFMGAGTTTAFLPVEVVEEPARVGLTLVSPAGYRIEGLGVTEAVELLRRLR
jgi:hypothetical protein